MSYNEQEKKRHPLFSALVYSLYIVKVRIFYFILFRPVESAGDGGLRSVGPLLQDKIRLQLPFPGTYRNAQLTHRHRCPETLKRERCTISSAVFVRITSSVLSLQLSKHNFKKIFLRITTTGKKKKLSIILAFTIRSVHSKLNNFPLSSFLIPLPHTSISLNIFPPLIIWFFKNVVYVLTPCYVHVVLSRGEKGRPGKLAMRESRSLTAKMRGSSFFPTLPSCWVI